MGDTTENWNFADVIEGIADRYGDRTLLVHGDVHRTWAEADRRADGIARTLLDAGAVEQDKVAQYLYNCDAYMESQMGIFKAGLVPVNTNYRYVEDELAYLWDNADAVAVIFHGCFADRCDAVRPRVPNVRTWIWVDDGTGPCPDWAIPYEQAASAATERVVPPWGRSGDHILMLYTGGTTGMPKGVMWRQTDLISILGGNTNPVFAGPTDVAAAVDSLAEGLVVLPACPLMHGTGWFNALIGMLTGGTVVTMEGRTFDVVEMLDTIEREGVNGAAIVGDAFAKPMLAALDAQPDRWDISSLKMMSSSGVMWSEATKEGLLRHHAGMLLVDAFSSSEALGMGQSVSAAGAAAKTAKFSLGQNARVIDDDGHDVEPGSGTIGRVAVAGRVPVGYYKDPEKTAATFITIDGQRYSMPGDYATVEADGSLTLLGRGSVCINTGGEKVFPEEVEEALKTHPEVRDAVVVGVPDEKFGQAITAVVEPADGGQPAENELIAHVKGRLASYKAPRHVVYVPTIGRAANGKVDYKGLTTHARAELGR
ncbi:acyl-CoA synthetase [Actinomarinicola tropica]|uniref:AMP-binding protein n=1 Tax=Actinomarinicola tropica TaxID=2789776 RepID=A0A5Q2RL53_9ACTN|nr:acyl-CoA synthetase [Actinomarinicola tropica]QGG94787.1 AMP-binding protein [Actinomarinicola tropica]